MHNQAPEVQTTIKERGVWTFQVHNPDGTLDREWSCPNGATSAFLTHMLATELTAGAAVTTWYMGLIDNASFSALAAGDTMASHAGWLESSAYSESVRQTWVGVTTGSTSTNTASKAVFTANGTVTINGAFLTSVSTKGGTTGTLAVTGSFSGTQALVNAQTLTVTLAVTLS